MKVYIVQDYDDIRSIWARKEDAENEAKDNINLFVTEYEVRGTP